MKKRNALKIHPKDNVAVVTIDVVAGVSVDAGTGLVFNAVESIPAGHKVAVADIPSGRPIVKCGEPIGIASTGIRRGSWAHTHNIAGGEAEG